MYQLFGRIFERIPMALQPACIYMSFGEREKRCVQGYHITHTLVTWYSFSNDNA